MFEGLRRDARLASLIPFVRQFYGRESTRKGGNKVTPDAGLRFAVGIHPALLAAHADLGPRAELYAFLDDTYVSCDPTDACAAFVALRRQLKRHANINVHLGKTRVCNSTEASNPQALLKCSRRRRDTGGGCVQAGRGGSLPPSQQLSRGAFNHPGYIVGQEVGEVVTDPYGLRPAVQRASLHRWTGILAVAAQRALAHSLLELPLEGADMSGRVRRHVLTAAELAPGTDADRSSYDTEALDLLTEAATCLAQADVTADIVVGPPPPGISEPGDANKPIKPPAERGVVVLAGTRMRMSSCGSSFTSESPRAASRARGYLACLGTTVVGDAIDRGAARGRGKALGAAWFFPRSATDWQPALEHVLALAEPGGPSRLPLR
ncbi:unnamed protein product [Symbiodinium sp. CCMP2592]|nr:unnamed protein product [Symbiodinium sp. CCMP2592]